MLRGSILNPIPDIKDKLDRSILQVDGGKPGKNLFVKNKRSPFNKFLEKSDIVEIALRDNQISNKEEIKLITLLYDNLAVPTSETVSLYKMLIYYEEIQTFEMLLTYRVEHNFKKERKWKVASFDSNDLGRKDDDNVYDFDEIISDAFAYSISLNKLHIAFYLFK